MAQKVQLACVQCGRPILVDVAGRRGLPRCDGCERKASNLVRQYQLHSVTGQITLDRSGVIARLRSNEIRGTDFVAGDDEVPRPLAGHPDFRTLFMPGHADFLVPPEKERRPLPAWIPRAVRWTATGSVVAVVGWYAALHPIKLPKLPNFAGISLPSASDVNAIVADAPPRAADSGPQAAIADANVPPTPRVPGPVDSLVARIGPVSDPRTLLHARAWNSRFEGSALGLDAAIISAEHAVARLPDDASTLALLAELYAEADREPALVAALLTRARTVDRGSLAVLRALVASAVRQGVPAETDAALQACFALDARDLDCRYWAMVARGAGTDAAVTLAQWDELVTAWPANRSMVRHAALFAAREDLASAGPRLLGLRRQIKEDVGIESAYATILYRDGDLAAGEDVVRRLGGGVSEDLVVTAAQGALARGDVPGALKWLEGRTFTGEDAGRHAALVDAQSRWILGNKAGGAAVDEARAAAVRLAEKRGTTMPILQARALIARLSGDAAGEAKLWALLDNRPTANRDDARVHLTHAWSDYERNQPREALSSCEFALRADAHSPAVYVWMGLVQIASHNPSGAFEAMRDAVRAVDGQDARRGDLGAALAPPVPTAELRDRFAELVGGDATLQSRGVFARATAAWLGGDDATALAEITPQIAKTEDAETMALAARIHLRRGNLPLASELAEKVARIRPKEAAYHLLHAQILVRQERWAEAEQAIGIVRSAGTPSALLYALSAEVARARGDKGAALIAAREAARFDPTDLDSRRLMRTIAVGG